VGAGRKRVTKGCVQTGATGSQWQTVEISGRKRRSAGADRPWRAVVPQ
jgi:hypothetical protein